MYSHHEEGIKNYTEKMKIQEGIQAVIIGGSIAHGFDTEKSDIDVMLVVSEEEYKRRLKASAVQFLEVAECSYEKCNIDGKYISMEYLKRIMQSGNEATRFAFKGAFAPYSRLENLETIIEEIQKYPVSEKQSKINRFYAQFKAWSYYCKHAFRNEDSYLLSFAASNLVLFGGRLILAHNETLFPYHKWFMRVLGDVKDKPEGIVEAAQLLIERRQKEDYERFYSLINDFRQWDDSGISWPNIFFHDSENNWIEGNTPVADL